MSNRTYYDWRGPDLGLLESYRTKTTLTTYYGGSTFQPIPQVTPEVKEVEK